MIDVGRTGTNVCNLPMVAHDIEGHAIGNAARCCSHGGPPHYLLDLIPLSGGDGILHISIEDIGSTKLLVAAGKVLGIDLLDHLIIGRGGQFVSLKERGLGFD